MQATDPKAMFRTEVFAGLAGLPANTYRVRAEGWSLKVQPQFDRRTPGADEAGPRVSLADLRFTLAPDGSTQGMARYEVEPRSGPFLPIELAGGAEPLWVAVNDLPTRPWREAPGRWLVPLEEGGASQVELIWRGPPRRRANGDRAADPPALDGPGTGAHPRDGPGAGGRHDPEPGPDARADRARSARAGAGRMVRAADRRDARRARPRLAPRSRVARLCARPVRAEAQGRRAGRLLERRRPVRRPGRARAAGPRAAGASGRR